MGSVLQTHLYYTPSPAQASREDAFPLGHSRLPSLRQAAQCARARPRRHVLRSGRLRPRDITHCSGAARGGGAWRRRVACIPCCGSARVKCLASEDVTCNVRAARPVSMHTQAARRSDSEVGLEEYNEKCGVIGVFNVEQALQSARARTRSPPSTAAGDWDTFRRPCLRPAPRRCLSMQAFGRSSEGPGPVSRAADA